MKWFVFLFLQIIILSCNEKTKENGKLLLEKEAYKLNNTGQQKKAIDIYNKLIERDSNNGYYYFGKGSAYGRLGQRENAIKCYFKAIDCGYRISASYYNIGLLHTFLKDSNAINYFNRALKTYSAKEIGFKRNDIITEINECKARLEMKN